MHLCSAIVTTRLIWIIITIFFRSGIVTTCLIWTVVTMYRRSAIVTTCLIWAIITLYLCWDQLLQGVGDSRRAAQVRPGAGAPYGSRVEDVYRGHCRDLAGKHARARYQQQTPPPSPPCCSTVVVVVISVFSSLLDFFLVFLCFWFSGIKEPLLRCFNTRSATSTYNADDTCVESTFLTFLGFLNPCPLQRDIFPSSAASVQTGSSPLFFIPRKQSIDASLYHKTLDSFRSLGMPKRCGHVHRLLSLSRRALYYRCPPISPYILLASRYSLRWPLAMA